MVELSLRLRKALKQDRTTRLEEWMNKTHDEYAKLAAKAGTIKREDGHEYRLTIAINRYEVPKPFWKLLCSENEVFRKQADGRFRGPLKQPNIGGYPVILSKADELKVIISENWVPIRTAWEKRRDNATIIDVAFGKEATKK